MAGVNDLICASVPIGSLSLNVLGKDVGGCKVSTSGEGAIKAGKE